MAREKDGVLLLCALFCFIVNGLCCELQNPRTITQDSEIEIIEVTIYFTGADPACDECATSTDESSSSFTYSSSSACGNANNTWSLGDWEGGLGSFQDPTPAGSSVVGASMEIWGYWNYQLETEGSVTSPPLFSVFLSISLSVSISVSFSVSVFISLFSLLHLIIDPE